MAITRNIIHILAIFLLPLSAMSAQNQPWTHPEHSMRAVISPPMSAKHTVLVTVPNDGDTNLSFVVCDGNNNLLRYRPVYVGHEKADVLVDLNNADFRYDCAIYYGATSEVIAEPTNGIALPKRPVRGLARFALKDPFPVVAEVRKLTGYPVPSSWEEMVYLNGTAHEASASTIVCRDFRASNLFFDISNRYGSSRAKGLYLILLRSNVLCPESGTYRFALDCKDAGFLLVDGNLTTSWPNEHEAGAWHVGKGITLSAGTHEVEVWNVATMPVRLDVGWIMPGNMATHSQHIGSGDIQSIPRAQLIAGFRPLTKSIEDIRLTLNPGFRYYMGNPYSFKGTRDIFVPVEFWNSSRNWLTQEMDCNWTFSSPQSGSTESKPSHVFVGTGLHPVKLSVKDSLGFTGQCEQNVDCRTAQPRYFVLDARVTDLPSAVYPGDLVAPMLDLNPDIGDPLDFSIKWSITYLSGATEEYSRSISLKDDPIRIPLIRTRARVLNNIKYRVEHLGAVLEKGSIRFVSTPLLRPAKSARGSYLHNQNGDIVVLVPDEYIGKARQPNLARDTLRRPVFCIDDTLGVGRFELRERRFDDILERGTSDIRPHKTVYQALPGWESLPDSYGPNEKLAQIPAMLESNKCIAVLSIGLPNILRQRDAGEFEREIAALSDTLLAMKIPVIWVTPPPYSFDPVRVRKYADAIVKVADARGMPLANVYSMFRLRTDDISLFENGSGIILSSQGQKRAAACIADQLVVTGEDDQ